MNSSFDPYHEWLGIPPEQQPPDHYQLLGVPRHESDASAIEAAADGRMLLVRSFQTGPRSRFTQSLLNEITAAKLCLLSPASRAAAAACSTTMGRISLPVDQDRTE